ncbi:hypothetical protein [Massilia horti]|uniref:Uncharacterized protein n=1 Tax=Massilia horti TaxID=2562153 RepID=A0A4Y9T392_9BURK|nr:hypothetical protein [Massilia horti]TFW32467.1 hypothetical protein E4O92_09785 [Massilia horti]
MLQITKTQMEFLTRQAFGQTVLDLADALSEHFDREDRHPAVNWPALTREDRVRLVDQIATIGAKHGFALRGELYALAEACVTVGPRGLLVDTVLEHPNLTPREKVNVMLDLYNQWGAPFRGPN